jgi:predicted transglutaminase-like cysteine proteinase
MFRLGSLRLRILFAMLIIAFGAIGGNASSYGAAPEWASDLRPVEAAAFQKWATVAALQAKEAAWLVESGAARRNPAARLFDALIRTASDRSAMAKLTTVNAFYNRLAYRSDRAAFGADTWLTPYRLILTGGGDCEDFALAKLFTLLALGFAPESLHLVVVQDVEKGIPHAVLAVDHAGVTWVLDNRSKTVLPWNRSMANYKPLYTVGPTAVGVYRAAG